MASSIEDEVRPVVDSPAAEVDKPAPGHGRVRAVAAIATTVLASVLVWFALVAPDDVSRLAPGALLRIPIEGVLLLALVLVLPRAASRVVVIVVGVALGLLTVVKILDMGFLATLDRPFNPVSDWSYLGPAVGLLEDSIGRAGGILAVIGAVLAIAAIIVLMPLAVGRLTRLGVRHRTTSIRFVSVLLVGWLIAALFGLQIAQGSPVAAAAAADLAADEVSQIRSEVKDQHTFASEISHDPISITPTNDLLTGLRGKDVLVLFVESYGQVAVQGSAFSPGVDAVLESGTKSLHSAGYSAESAFLTSPTFGGISWLAHSTLQSGLWIDSQQRYNQLVASNRFTLSEAFRRAGWRTVGDVPSNGDAWPQGTSFYHYDELYGDHNVGYRGPSFSYASMPDQYILSAFQRLELAKTDHAPVMAEIDLVSSHTPWAPLPRMIPWNEVGDGSAFAGMPAEGSSPTEVWKSADQVRAAYGQSIEYTVNTLVSFVRTYPDPNLVLLVLGDHQPAKIVSGEGATHNVPVSIIAHDPAVLGRIAPWGWEPGLLPSPQAPVWPMDTFRNRFLEAYG